MADICMAGVGGANSITMHGKSGFEYEPGMAVTLTGANEVGPGVAAGSLVFGIVTKVEKDADDDIVLGVQVTGFNDHVQMNGTAAVVGDIACCNAAGLLIKAPTTAPTGVPCGVVTAVDATNKLATVRLF